MPQATQADWNRPGAPEYPAAAGRRSATEAHPVSETATEARAGVTGHHVSTVLIVSTVAAIVAFALIYLVFFGGA